MSEIKPGAKAPLFSLKASDGKNYSLQESLSGQPFAIVSFFKISCPVCQLTFPFLQRLQERYPSIMIWGVSQDDMANTKAFAQNYGVKFPMLLDETLSATVDYDLMSVPSTFVVSQDGTLKNCIYGFSKADMEELNTMCAAAAGKHAFPLFTADEDVPALKPG